MNLPRQSLFAALSVVLFGRSLLAQSSVQLSADGPGDTYELITAALAPGEMPIEVPDRGHPEFGRHITEVWDEDLGCFVFVFHIHLDEDDDRGVMFDRQRTEIKTYNESPAHLQGTRGETHEYRWRFRVDQEFRVSPRFTHLFQIKAVGGSDDGQPVLTLSAARRDKGDRIELRHGANGRRVRVVADNDLALIRGRWIEGRCRMRHDDAGSLTFEIRSLDGQRVLFYEREEIDVWRSGADFNRPKWGIYRKIVADAGLRDEQVRFADFMITENPQ